METQDDARRLATLERYLGQHIHLARPYRAQFGPQSGLVQVNATALSTTMGFQALLEVNLRLAATALLLKSYDNL